MDVKHDGLINDRKDQSTSNDKNFHVQSIYSLMTKTDTEIVYQIGAPRDENNDERFTVGMGSNSSETETSRKSVLHRMFSKMEAGSLRGSIFAMSSLALGTGCLALPIRFSQMSMSCALVVLFFGSIAAYWSLIIMIEASNKTNSRDYSTLVKESLGTKASLILNITMLIYILGILISYQVIIYQLIGSFVYEVGFTNDYPTSKQFEKELWYTDSVKFPISYLICALLIPLCLIKDISRMRIASLFSIIGLLYAIFVILIECPWYYQYYIDNIYKEDRPETHINWFDWSTGFDSNLNFFRGAATVFFAYTCHVGAFPVYKTLKNNVQRRINKVFQRSILLDFVFYLIVGICGFLTQPLNTPELIINRDKLLTNDIAMIIARLFMAINLTLSTPANFNALRLCALNLIWDTEEVTNKNNIIITIPTLIITCFVAIVFNKVIAYISILGGFCSVILAFLFPGLVYIKNNDYPLSHWKNMSSLIIIIILSAIGFIAGIMTISDAFKK